MCCLDIPLSAEVFFHPICTVDLPLSASFLIPVNFVALPADRAGEDAGFCYKPVTQIRVSEVKMSYPRALGNTYYYFLTRT